MAEDLPEGWEINEEWPDDWRAYLQQQSKNAEVYFSKESKKQACEIVQEIKECIANLTAKQLRRKKFKYIVDVVNETVTETVIDIMKQHNLSAEYDWMSQMFIINWE